MKEKKLSLESIVNEADVLQYDQNLKFNVSQKLPHFMKAFMQQLKADQYEQAAQTLSQLAAACQETQQQLQAAIAKNPQVKKQGTQQPTGSNISDKEI